MHPTVGYHLSQDHLAYLRHQAQRSARARAARQARRPRPHQSSRPRPALPALARQALAALGSTTTQSRPPGAPTYSEVQMSKLHQLAQGVGGAE
jgi:hypothetical protein